MKRFVLGFLIAIVLFSLFGCSVGPVLSYSTDAEALSASSYEDLHASLSLWADDAEAEADFKISDLSIDDANAALSTLRSYINGRSVSTKNAFDSVTYLERYIRALENQFDYLENLLN